MNNVNVFFETNFETDLKNELSKKNYENCIFGCKNHRGRY
mgnify:CR=1 FL=1